MFPAKICVGQITIVFGIVVATEVGAMQRADVARNVQQRLGKPSFSFVGYLVYLRWRLRANAGVVDVTRCRVCNRALRLCRYSNNVLIGRSRALLAFKPSGSSFDAVLARSLLILAVNPTGNFWGDHERRHT